MNKSGKIMIIAIIIIVNVLVLGYYFVLGTPATDKELEEKMTKASQEYFEKYTRTNETTATYEITLEDLENANSNGESYDLKGLEECDKKNTLSKITINYTNGKPKKVEVNLKC